MHLKITKIPFKSGNYVIDLQHESSFVKKMLIEPIDWIVGKVIFEVVEMEKKW